jgi:signal transduction histidine kinase
VVVRALYAPLAPLARGTTYRRGVYLLLGGVLALPYVLLGASFVQTITSDPPQRALTLLLLGVATLIAAVPPFLHGTRAVEIAAVRWLLEVDLPDPPRTREPARVARETRLRAVLWFVVHLIVGAAVWLLLLAALPLALLFLVEQVHRDPEALTALPFGSFAAAHAVWLSLAGVLLLVTVGYAVAGLGALAAVMAPVLLGPSPTERIAVLEAEARALAVRNRLARDLHDSIGHALTVTTLQASVARELLDSDPEFVRGALSAIEDAGRTAMEDLDHVLGVLRDDAGGTERPGTAARAPHRTLADLDRLAADADRAGVTVTLDLDGPVADVPAVVSREGYRIIQEGLTNALRHAGAVPVRLAVRVDEGSLRITLANPAAESAGPHPSPHPHPPPRPDGRGLTGIRERVELLGGQMSAGWEDAEWRIAVRLPTT